MPQGDEKDRNTLGEAIALSKTNAEQISGLRSDLASFAGEIRNVIERLSNRLDEKTTPNFNTIWAATGVLATVMIAFGALVSSGFQRELDSIKGGVRDEIIAIRAEIGKLDVRNDKLTSTAEARYGELDMKLQRESVLLNDAVKAEVSAVRGESEKNFRDNHEDINRIRDWTSDRVKADLEELRARRMAK